MGFTLDPGGPSSEVVACGDSGSARKAVATFSLKHRQGFALTFIFRGTEKHEGKMKEITFMLH